VLPFHTGQQVYYLTGPQDAHADPLPAVYIVFALVPVSKKAQPDGTTDEVAVLANVLKSCV